MEEVFETILSDLMAEEGITHEDLELVDIDISFSPVIAIRGESIKDAVDVTETVGGKYIVHHGLISNPVSADGLKIMRYRYLSERGKSGNKFI